MACRAFSSDASMSGGTCANWATASDARTSASPRRSATRRKYSRQREIAGTTDSSEVRQYWIALRQYSAMTLDRSLSSTPGSSRRVIQIRTLAGTAAAPPERVERPCHLGDRVELTGREEVIHRRPQLVLLVEQPCHPLYLALPGRGRVGGDGEPDVEVGVPLLRLGEQAPLGEPVPAVLAHRCEHREPGARPSVLLAHEAAVDERAQRLHGIHPVEAVGHPLDRIQPEAGAEDPQPQEQLPLGIRQQLSAPVDRRPQRALALGQVARAADEQGQGVVEPFDQRGRGQHAQPGGGELDRERDIVERSADRDDMRGVVVGELEVGLDRTRTLREQLGGLRRRKRAERDVLLAAHPEQDPAGAEHGCRRSGQQRADLRRGLDHLLDVVEDEQQAAAAECPGELLGERPITGVADAERVRDRREHEAGLQYGREVDEHHAVGECGLHLACRRHREPALAYPAGAGDGHEPLSFVGQHPPDDRRVRVHGRRAG